MEEARQPGTGLTHIVVSPAPIDPGALAGLVSHPRAGAVCLFVGTVRNHSPGREGVTHLEYEAYGGVVEAKLAAIVAEARERWALLSVALVHRLGSLAVGEASLGVAVSSPHRGEGLDAVGYLVDEVKRRAPIWKKEHWAGGAEWVGGEGRR
jgi:molybdopterin synthase catalytic subunit